MAAITPGRTLGAIIGIVAVFATLSALSIPIAERRPETITVAIDFALLLLHAALYGFGDRIRARFGLRVYAAAQAATLFGITLAGVPDPIALALLMTFTAELVLLARGRWGALPITASAIAFYVVAALVTSGIYRAATAGLLLAMTGAMAHMLAALVRRPGMAGRDVMAIEPAGIPGPDASSRGNLSAREAEVLKHLVGGERNIEIAAALGISERTVKAHLAHIYQKLGVESRSAAVAAALKRGLV
jgi:NarL family two-component system response regulator YdfI